MSFPVVNLVKQQKTAPSAILSGGKQRKSRTGSGNILFKQYLNCHRANNPHVRVAPGNGAMTPDTSNEIINGEKSHLFSNVLLA